MCGLHDAGGVHPGSMGERQVKIQFVENEIAGSPAGIRVIQTPVAGASRPVFRLAFTLRFALGPVTDRLEIDSDKCSLQGSFEPFDYDALTIAEPSLKAALSTLSGAIVVTLDGPREVRRIRLSSTRGIVGPKTVEIYRLDGSVLAEKPTVAAAVENRTAVFHDSFTDARFAIRIKTMGGVEAARTDDLAELQLRSYPMTPRLGLQTLKPPPEALFFWQTSGEVGKGVAAEKGVVNAGKPLATELIRHLDAQMESLKANQREGGLVPSWLGVALCAESDAPCSLKITQLDVSYHLVVESFSSGAEKELLRFQGGKVIDRQTPFRLPLNALVKNAEIRMAESLRSEALLPQELNGAPLFDPTGRKEGIRLETGAWAAVRETPHEAMVVSGIALALMATRVKTEVLVQLREDWSNEPAGKTLAQGALMLEAAGKPSVMKALFPETPILPVAPVWILVKAIRGHAVWLIDPGTESVHLLADAAGGSLLTEVGALRSIRPLRGFITRLGDEQAAHLQATLRLGRFEIPLSGNHGEAATHDFTAALQGYLSEQPASPLVSDLSLTFRSVAQGLITAYPPRIVFDL